MRNSCGSCTTDYAYKKYRNAVYPWQSNCSRNSSNLCKTQVRVAQLHRRVCLFCSLLALDRRDFMPSLLSRITGENETAEVSRNLGMKRNRYGVKRVPPFLLILVFHFSYRAVIFTAALSVSSTSSASHLSLVISERLKNEKGSRRNKKTS